MNVYNEGTVAVLSRLGARSICLPVELSVGSIRELCSGTRAMDVAIEVQVFGRVTLALSGRCFHARAFGRTRDSCQFACESDSDGLELRTLDGAEFLAINGTHTMSYGYINLLAELPDLRASGVSRFRLSPHTCDMVKVLSIFRSVLDQRVAAEEGALALGAMKLPGRPCNGFYYGKPGHTWAGNAVG
jgi:collagenase-like PrtC family protease